MADIIQYDPLTGQVLRLVKSVHTPHFKTRKGFVINPEVPEGNLTDYRYLNGKFVKKTKEEILEEEKLEKLYNYKSHRAKDYPSIEDQLDMLWHAMDKGLMPKAGDFYEYRS